MRKRLLAWKPPYLIGMVLVLLLLVGGVAGLFLPILQGVLMITLGLLLLMEYHEIPALEKKREEYVERYHTWQEKRAKRKDPAKRRRT